MSDNVEFMSMDELSAKVTLDGTEEIQVSPSEKVNLLRVIQANAGRVNTLHGTGNLYRLFVTNNHTDWLVKNRAVIPSKITVSLEKGFSTPPETTTIEYTLVLRAGYGSTVEVAIDHDLVQVQQDTEDPIVKLDTGLLTLLGSGTYIFNIRLNASAREQAYDINIDCNYIQPDNIIRYKTYNNSDIGLSTINHNALGGTKGSANLLLNYDHELNIGELYLLDGNDKDTPFSRIPTSAFSCFEIPIDGKTGVTTHFLSEVWLPSSVIEVAPGAFTGCNYIHKFHGGTPGLVSPDGTQILNTYWNGRVELAAVAPCALGHPVLYPGIGGFTRDEILTFYVDERADSIGDLVFAHMPLSVPIRTVVLGRNVRTTGGTTFFNNECICTLILGDNFLQYNPGVFMDGRPTNRPLNLSRLVCSNQIPNGVYPNDGDKKIEYLLAVPTPGSRNDAKAIIESSYGSTVSGTLPNIMKTAFMDLYPLENEIIYSGKPVFKLSGTTVFSYIEMDYFMTGLGDIIGATSEPIYPYKVNIDNTTVYPGFGDVSNYVISYDDKGDTHYRSLVNNPNGLDMFFGFTSSGELVPALDVGTDNSVTSAPISGMMMQSIRFPKSLVALGGYSIRLGKMESPLDIYLYSVRPVIVCGQIYSSPVPLFAIPEGATLHPITIHIPKLSKWHPKFDETWQPTIEQLGDTLTIVQDLTTY